MDIEERIIEGDTEMIDVSIIIEIPDTDVAKLLKDHNCIERVKQDLIKAGYNPSTIKKIVTESVNNFYKELTK